MAYPPGIPAILPGERISEEFLNWLTVQPASLLTASGSLDTTIRCLKDPGEK